MRYRNATRDDAPLLAEMNLQLIHDEGHRNKMTPDELAARMCRWLSGEYRAVLFEEEAGTAGYALFRVEPDCVYVRQFFVRPGRRRNGIGRAALEHLASNVWQDSPRVRLDVLTGNAVAIAFWRSVGFVDYCITMERGQTEHR